MRGGELRHLITVQKPTDSVGGMGGASETWGTHSTFRAAVRYISGGEKADAQQVLSDNKVLFKIRYSSEANTITTKMRVSFDSRFFDIEFIKPFKEMNREVHLVCREIT